MQPRNASGQSWPPSPPVANDGQTRTRPIRSSTAFVFANGDAHDGPLLRQTFARYPDAWIIAADGGARHAQHFGFSVDVLIGDLDSLDAEAVAQFVARGAELHRFPAEKDETDLELALLYAAAQNLQRILIVAAVGDRIDQTLSNLYLLSLPALRRLDVRLIAGKQATWLAHPGRHVIEGAVGDTVSLLPIKGDVHLVQTEHLQYALHDETLRFGSPRGVSNVMLRETAAVSFRRGLLLIVHTLGRA